MPRQRPLDELLLVLLTNVDRRRGVDGGDGNQQEDEAEAETQAEALRDRAQSKADETMRGADQYASDVLVRLESDLVKTLSIVKKSLEVLEERRPQPLDR